MNAGVARELKFENLITAGNVYTIIVGIAAMGTLYGTMTADFKALAQRVEINDRRDEKAVDTLGELKNSVTRIEAEQRAMRDEANRSARQLDRIEGLLRNEVPPSRPPFMNEPPPQRLPLKIP